MKFDRKTVFVVAVASAVLAALLTVHYIQGVKKQLMKGLEPVKALVARQDMRAGEVVEEEGFVVRLFPKRYLHPAALKPGDLPLVVGQRLRNPVFKGHPVLWSDLGAGESNSRVSEGLMESERAVSVAVDGVSGVSGLIQPGDHVDILWTYSGVLPDGRAGTLVTSLLQNVTVLAAGGRTVPGHGGYSTVTLALTLREAEIVTFAQQKGKITLVLRNRRDVSVLDDQKVLHMQELLGREMKRIQKARTLRIIRGKQQ